MLRPGSRSRSRIGSTVRRFGVLERTFPCIPREAIANPAASTAAAASCSSAGGGRTARVPVHRRNQARRRSMTPDGFAAATPIISGKSPWVMAPCRGQKPGRHPDDAHPVGDAGTIQPGATLCGVRCAIRAVRGLRIASAVRDRPGAGAVHRADVRRLFFQMVAWGHDDAPRGCQRVRHNAREVLDEGFRTDYGVRIVSEISVRITRHASRAAASKSGPSAWANVQLIAAITAS